MDSNQIIERLYEHDGLRDANFLESIIAPDFIFEWDSSQDKRLMNKNDIIALASTVNDTFTLNTGNTNLVHIFAIPSEKTLVSVIDQDPFPIPLMNNYNLSSTITSINGEPYKVYVLTIVVPYSSNHRHNIILE